MSIDADQLEGMSEEELKRRYDEQSRGRAGVPGARNTEGTYGELIYLLVSLTCDRNSRFLRHDWTRDISEAAEGDARSGEGKEGQAVQVLVALYYALCVYFT